VKSKQRFKSRFNPALLIGEVENSSQSTVNYKRGTSAVEKLGNQKPGFLLVLSETLFLAETVVLEFHPEHEDDSPHVRKDKPNFPTLAKDTK
jgi:hypothetical protein